MLTSKQAFDEVGGFDTDFRVISTTWTTASSCPKEITELRGPLTLT